MRKAGSKKDTVISAIRVKCAIILFVVDCYLSSIPLHTQTFTKGDNGFHLSVRTILTWPRSTHQGWELRSPLEQLTCAVLGPQVSIVGIHFWVHVSSTH